MTESEWLTCDDPSRMLEFLTGSRERHGSYIDPSTSYFREEPIISERKLRLFAASCLRREWGLLDAPSRNAVEVAERFADANATQGEVYDAIDAIYRQLRHPFTPDGADQMPRGRLLALAAYNVAPQTDRTRIASHTYGMLNYLRQAFPESMARHADDLREIVGDPFHPAPSVDHAWLTPDVLRLAFDAYECRDFEAMPILADALEEAGCDGPSFACGHCGGSGSSPAFEFDPPLPLPVRGEGRCDHCDGEGRVRRSHPLLAHLRSPGPHVRGCWALDLILGKE